MKQFIISYLPFILLIATAITSCRNLEKVAPGPEIQMVYINDFLGKPQKSFSVDESGGSTSFLPRISNPMQTPVDLIVSVDDEALKSYNKENNTQFAQLPAETYDLVLLSKSGEVLEKGKEIKLSLAAGEYGREINVQVTKMSKTVTGKDGTSEEEPLPTFQNFAIPVSIKSVAGNNVSSQANARSGILLINRKFTAKAAHFSGGGAWFWYRVDKGDSDEPLPEDIPWKQWTYQVFVRFDRIGDGNIGWTWNNRRKNGEEWGYHCLYGPKGFTMFTSAGKLGFNQKGYEDFEFKPNQWYHMAMTSDEKEDGKTEVRYYIDGNLALSVNLAGHSQGWYRAFLGNSAFKGYIRDFRVWTKALTQGEINETMWAVNPESEGLELYMPLDGNFDNKIPGKENYWIIGSKGTARFDSSFTFPEEKN